MSGQVLFESLGAYILVFCRMGSMLFFNPLLARKNVVSSIKIALALGLTLIITPTLNTSQIEAFEGLVFLFAMLKEFMVGFAAGLILAFVIVYIIELADNRIKDQDELAEKTGYEVAETSQLLCASLPVLSLTVDDENGEFPQADITLGDTTEEMGDSIALKAAVEKLCERDRKIVEFRY